MKAPLLTLLLSLSLTISYAQPYFDSLLHELHHAKDDTNKVTVLCALAQYHEYIQPDSNLYYINKAIELSEKINYPYGKLLALVQMFFGANLRADYTKALEIAQNNLNVASELKKDRLYNMAMMHLEISLVSNEMGDQKKQISETLYAFELQKKSGQLDGDFWGAFSTLSGVYLFSHPDSALYYARKGYELSHLPSHQKPYMCLATAFLANTFQAMGNYDSASRYYQEALQQSIAYNNVYIQARIYRDMARLFNKMGVTDSCLHYAQLALQLCHQYNFGDYGSQVGQILSNLYESQHKPDSALKYMKITQAAKDSIFSPAKMQQFQLLLSKADQKQREATAAAEGYRNKVKLYSLIAVACVFLILLLILYRNNRQKQRAFTLIKQQKHETDIQKVKVEQAYQELKSAQDQLIQSEKMASLGELTAGIAHEIQNPLNFVNNFSEVNTELLDEMELEIDKARPEDLKAILKDIKENERKINHHGKRADAIVKGMLQHSRSNAGQKELTDINALADEYLRLSYHCLRAKEKSFNASIQTDFDKSIGKKNIIPQDIGRALLNLYNNAFYAVMEKSAFAKVTSSAVALANDDGSGYEPTVIVSTRRNGNKIEIRIRDNGMGIPEKVLNKIFQPFFTTKPTGQGTGLGLSLSYDIVKAHGGEIHVETIEGECATFIIQLPGNV